MITIEKTIFRDSSSMNVIEGDVNYVDVQIPHELIEKIKEVESQAENGFSVNSESFRVLALDILKAVVTKVGANRISESLDNLF